MRVKMNEGANWRRCLRDTKMNTTGVNSDYLSSTVTEVCRRQIKLNFLFAVSVTAAMTVPPHMHV